MASEVPNFDLNKVASAAFPLPESYPEEVPYEQRTGIFEPSVFKMVAQFLGGDSAKVASAISVRRSVIPSAGMERDFPSSDLMYLQRTIVKSCLGELGSQRNFLDATVAAIEESDVEMLLMLFRLKTFLKSSFQFDMTGSSRLLKVLVEHGSPEALRRIIDSRKLTRLDQALTRDLLDLSTRNAQDNQLPDADLQKLQILAKSRLLVSLDGYERFGFPGCDNLLKIRGVCAPLIAAGVFGTETSVVSMKFARETFYYRNVLCAVLQVGRIYDLYSNLIFDYVPLLENTLTIEEAEEVLKAFEVAFSRSQLKETKDQLSVVLNKLKENKYFDALSKEVLNKYMERFTPPVFCHIL